MTASSPPADGSHRTDVVATTARYVCDERHRLRLFEAVGRETRRVSLMFQAPEFSTANHLSDDDVRARVAAFEIAVADLCRVEALLAHWGNSLDTLTLPLRRLGDGLASGGGRALLLGLRAYPTQLVLYAGGIAAVSSGRYGHLLAMLHTQLHSPHDDDRLIISAIPSMLRDAVHAFKLLPDFDRRRTPVSDRLFDVLQPVLDDLLFLGSDYERAFDRFELFQAVEHAHQMRGGWSGGRFEWKRSNDPLLALIKEVENADDSWPPLAAGLCGGSVAKFREVLSTLRDAVSRRGW